ncbi:MAG: L-seryl-tRNA(Sec) selenium transferase [Chloroflexi bacterium]|nr:L-seryl-tRNA(Sec) selenium transferase [Chloroflexota bacterium]
MTKRQPCAKIALGVDLAFRQLPSVDQLLGHPRVEYLCHLYPRQEVTIWVRGELEQARRGISAGAPPPTLDELATGVEARAQALGEPSLRAVINATGVILHTNLGRAPISYEALAAMRAVGLGYSNLEYDLARGERGSRQAHVESLLCHLTGAEAALAVNNNASALLLGLASLARGREVIVSRGQAIEIGGGFRIPDVLSQSRARLVEVGTTNRTYIADYEAAITRGTAALLRVHTSNFRVVGFTQSVSLEEMVALGQQRSIPVLDDLGSGCLLETSQFGMAHEPTIQESLEAGADLVFASGDKLLGGPQAGIIMGKRELVERLRRHPLARAVRIDKFSLAGLSATLVHYLRGEALSKVPIWRMISTPLTEIEARAHAWVEQLGEVAQVMPGQSAVGGGSLPGQTLPTSLVALSVPQVEELALLLRTGEHPVVGRIAEGKLLLDPRTVLPEEEGTLLSTLAETLAG